MDITSPSGVKKTDKKQASPEFAHESPYFYEFFFWPWGVTARLQPKEEFANMCDRASELE